jgi:tripartite ATP-independent transporter DctP family solute receptor
MKDTKTVFDAANVKRRTFLKIAGGAAAAGAAGALFMPAIARAQTPEFRFKLGISLPESHPNPVGLKAAAAKILEETGGRMSIEVFPAGQLGSDTDMLSQVRSGALELFSTAGGVWGTLIPLCSINGVAFAWPDYETLWKAYDGDLGAHIRAQFAQFGLVPQDKIWDHGFRQMTTGAKPIATAADLAGLKFRVPNSPLAVSLFEKLGSSPTSINFGELYSALQTGLVDGQENALATIESGKLYEVQKYCAMTDHMWDGFWLVANQAVWDTVPQDLRDTAWRIFGEAADEERVVSAQLGDSLKATLEGHGMVFNEVDQASFRTKLQETGFYSEWKEKFGAEAWGLLEKYTGPLA